MLGGGGGGGSVSAHLALADDYHLPSRLRVYHQWLLSVRPVGHALALHQHYETEGGIQT